MAICRILARLCLGACSAIVSLSFLFSSSMLSFFLMRFYIYSSITLWSSLWLLTLASSLYIVFFRTVTSSAFNCSSAILFSKTSFTTFLFWISFSWRIIFNFAYFSSNSRAAFCYAKILTFNSYSFISTSLALHTLPSSLFWIFCNSSDN